MIAYCRGMVKLQVLISDGGSAFIWINTINGAHINYAYAHKTICTMSAIPLCGAIEEKNNTTAAKPIGRAAFMPRAEEDIDNQKDLPYNHKTISILSVLSL